jgi:Putative phage metallopeptidase
MRQFADTFALLPEAQAQLDLLRTTDPEFQHLQRTCIGALGSQRVILDRGATCRALVVKPAQLAGKQIERLFHEWAIAQLFRPLYGGTVPDFVVFFDVALWQSNDALEREQLCYHELTHVQQVRDEYDVPKFDKHGQALLRLVAHDAEVFYSELRRYGRVVPTFDDTAIAISIGARATRRRTLRRA